MLKSLFKYGVILKMQDMSWSLFQVVQRVLVLENCKSINRKTLSQNRQQLQLDSVNWCIRMIVFFPCYNHTVAQMLLTWEDFDDERRLHNLSNTLERLLQLHARGPMGLEELCTYKYIIHGNGQVRIWYLQIKYKNLYEERFFFRTRNCKVLVIFLLSK